MLTSTPKVIIILLLIVLIIIFIYKFIKVIASDIRKKKIKQALIKITAVFIILFSFQYLINLRNGVNIPFIDGQNKKYIINFNEIKSSGDTKIRINDVLIDLNRLSFNVGVKGRDKLVAIEAKKNLQDEEPLMALKGLWVGKRFEYSYGAYGISYNSDSLIDPIYIVCYLSSGEEVSFKVNDMKNMKSLCKVITINKDFQKDGEKIRVRTFTKGVTYGNLYIVSDLGFYETEVSIFIDGKEYKNLPASAAGGEENYNTPPIGDNKTYVKIKVKNTGKEYKVDIQ